MKKIIYQKFIVRQDLRDNPTTGYVFGDNVLRYGMGGQAKYMRGELNAIGIATKRSPGMYKGDFFEDGNASDTEAVTYDLMRLKSIIDNDRQIIAPYDGIGTGLSELPTRAPKLYNHIWDFFRYYSDENFPWQKV